MATISERLRRPLVDGVERMPGTCCAEAADTIDALVAALDSIAAEMKPLAARKHTRYAGLHWAITEVDAALALARKGG